MSFKTIRAKILKGDFTHLFSLDHNKNYMHPAEVAKIISSLPADAAFKAFAALSEKYQVDIFSYLAFESQKKMMAGVSREKAAHILNELNSDDRFTFFSLLQGIEQTSLLELLSEKNRRETFNYIGFPKKSI